jgi:hypothetical protein
MNSYRTSLLKNGTGFLTFLVALAGILGCGEARSGPADKAAEKAPPQQSSFDASTAGIIRGQVNWIGDPAKVPDFRILPNFVGGEAFHKVQIRPNPNTPTVAGEKKGIVGAVVFLHGVAADRAKPWNHGRVTIEQRDCQFHVVQDGNDSHCGFVRQGDSIAMLSRDRLFYTLHAGGAEFFSLTFPDPDQPLQRTLNRNGIVELTSGAGYFWMRGYLFVDDHPYYTRTDSQGYFELTDVPPGRYELVCWLPNWLEAGHDRDPESRLISRLRFRPAVEKSHSLTLNERHEENINISFKSGDFER